MLQPVCTSVSSGAGRQIMKRLTLQEMRVRTLAGIAFHPSECPIVGVRLVFQCWLVLRLHVVFVFVAEVSLGRKLADTCRDGIPSASELARSFEKIPRVALTDGIGRAPPDRVGLNVPRGVRARGGDWCSWFQRSLAHGTSPSLAWHQEWRTRRCADARSSNGQPAREPVSGARTRRCHGGRQPPCW